jgi:hypothetical protein
MTTSASRVLHTLRRATLAVLVAAAACAPAAAAEYNTAFTYQGGLKASGVAVNSAVNLEFRLYDVASLGIPLSAPIVLNGTPVVDGVFSVTLDFGTAALTRDERWLEVVVNSTILTPRQKLAPAPVAQTALIRAPLFFGGQIQESPFFAGTTGAYATPFGITDAVYTESRAQMVMPRACIARNLVVRHIGSGPYANTTVVLRVNGVSSTLACGPVPQAGTCSDLVNSVAVAAGDLVALQFSPNLPARPITNSESEIQARVAFSWVCE